MEVWASPEEVKGQPQRPEGGRRSNGGTCRPRGTPSTAPSPLVLPPLRAAPHLENGLPDDDDRAQEGIRGDEDDGEPRLRSLDEGGLELPLPRPAAGVGLTSVLHQGVQADVFGVQGVPHRAQDIVSAELGYLEPRGRPDGGDPPAVPVHDFPPGIRVVGGCPVMLYPEVSVRISEHPPKGRHRLRDGNGPR
jgi:hypothetical protein